MSFPDSVSADLANAVPWAIIHRSGRHPVGKTLAFSEEI